MLVLSRKRGEKIVIGDDMSVVVNRIDGSRVTLAIEAPKGVSIRRGEVHERLKELASRIPDLQKERETGK